MENITVKRAMDAYQNEARFRAMAQSCVALAMKECGPVDPERAEADAYDIAVLATMTLLQRIYDEDAELRNLRAHNAHLEKLVKELNATATVSFKIPKEAAQ